MYIYIINWICYFKANKIISENNRCSASMFNEPAIETLSGDKSDPPYDG